MPRSSPHRHDARVAEERHELAPLHELRPRREPDNAAKWAAHAPGDKAAAYLGKPGVIAADARRRRNSPPPARNGSLLPSTTAFADRVVYPL